MALASPRSISVFSCGEDGDKNKAVASVNRHNSSSGRAQTRGKGGLRQVAGAGGR